ncbi:MAG: hypothetical protein LBU77_06990 [Clostridiales bacterium]|jgi:UDP-N-acetylmuramoyl-L-alanyl-D-glutamate--2,6-diaminopimelate ligase|nr:hypothetical protein [Clostridiales bacterium]
MLKIGIVGGSEISDTADLLAHLFHAKGLWAKTLVYADADSLTEFGAELSMAADKETADVSIEKIQPRPGSLIKNDYDVLIVNSLGADNAVAISKDGHDAAESRMILLNSDEKNIFKALQNDLGSARVITYGLNSKACVTASSISDATVQFCIQRALPTFSGEIMEQQEFTVKADTVNNDVSSILAAVTAAIVNGCDTNLSL